METEDKNWDLDEKIEEWFNNLIKFRNTEVRQIYRINKKELDKIVKTAKEKLNRQFLQSLDTDKQMSLKMKWIQGEFDSL